MVSTQNAHARCFLTRQLPLYRRARKCRIRGPKPRMHKRAEDQSLAADLQKALIPQIHGLASDMRLLAASAWRRLVVVELLASRTSRRAVEATLIEMICSESLHSIRRHKSRYFCPAPSSPVLYKQQQTQRRG